MKRALDVAAVLGALALTAFGLGRFWLLSSLPPPGGREPVTGLTRSVTVLFDSLAVPHVLAASHADAYAALGYLHARDRLFQMELLRHAALGRLSELFGARTVDADRELRALEMGPIAGARAAGMSTASRTAAEAYARGVNAWIAGGTRALEVRILRHAPEPWTPEHSLAIGLLQAWDLHFAGDELDLAALAARLGEEKARELVPTYSDTMPIIINRGWGMRDGGEGERDDALPPAASNSWVIAGSRTASGKPILANDPHLVLRAPSLWYLAGLHAPGLDVVGASIPGVPAIVLGHTPRVAWGFTNAMVDDVDYVLEELSPDSSRSRSTDGWAPVAAVAETIRVRGADPVVYRRRRTVNGPLVDAEPRPDSVHAVALRWVAQDGGADELAALHGWARAADAREFVAAAATFRSPEQNVVYADAAGHIGYLLAGAVPVRRAGEGVFPVAGTAGPAWTRYLAAGELPSAMDSPEGRIATANNRIVGDAYPFHISHHYDHAYRARRILELVDGSTRLTAADVARQQLDQLDLFAKGVKRIAARAALDAGRADVADRLRTWDGTMAADRVEPALFWAWYRHLQRLTYGDESPDYRPAAPLHRWLAAGDSPWFDDTRTPEVETLGTLARQAMDSALADRLGVWGEAHRTVMGHPLGEVPVLGSLIGFTVGPFPSGGSNHTVNVALTTRMRAPYTSGYGPSMRHVVDLAAPDDAGGFIIPTGQSGHPLSRHYRDQLDWWRAGRLWILPVDPARVRAVDTLTLVP
jgi:penicillin amidase